VSTPAPRSDARHPHNDRYPYWPLPERPPLRWPNGARIALWVIPNIEYFRFDAAFGGHGGRIPDIPSYGVRDYGARVGIWRLIDVLDKYNLRATVALNSEACRFHPQIIRAGLDRGWEWMGHGETNSLQFSSMTADEQCQAIASTLSEIADATGQTPTGWLSPGLQETYDTPDLLAEAGISYLCDWPSDEQPFPIRVSRGRMIGVPAVFQIADLNSYHRNFTAEQHHRIQCEHFDALYEDAERSGRLMSIPLHAYVSGLPGPSRWLDRTLSYITAHPGIWLTTGGEIADWYYRHYYEAALKASGTD
jgi:allantoinase